MLVKSIYTYKASEGSGKKKKNVSCIMDFMILLLFLWVENGKFPFSVTIR